MLNICYHFLNNREDAEDTAQEVFVEIYQSIHRFRGDSKLFTWIYRIAAAKSLDLIRKRKRKKRFAFIKGFFDLTEFEKNKLKSDSLNPGEIIERKDRAAILQKAVDSLSANQRTAIILNKYEGLSYAEVAETMGTSLSSVESIIHRAKKNLEKILKMFYDENF